MAAMLDKLPNELLLVIFKDFAVRPTQLHKDPYKAFQPIHQKWLTLANLCRTCKNFRNLAEPLLYQNYAKRDTVLAPKKHLQFHCFLQTILKRPELAGCIRTLHIGAWPHPESRENYFRNFEHNEGDEEEPNLPSFELVSLFLEHARKTNIVDKHRKSWITSLEEGDEDAEITLLLSLTTNLEHLEFAIPNFDSPSADLPGEPFFFPQLLTQFSEGCPLGNLRSLTVYKNDLDPMNQLPAFELDGPGPNDGGYLISPFLPFLNLPKLENLVAEETHQLDNYENQKYPVCKARSSKLKSLSLRLCRQAPETLEHLVSRCSGLEVFECNFSEDTFDTTVFSWDAIGHILRHQRHSLRELILDSENMSHLSFEDPSDPLRPVGRLVSVGSLKEFTNLSYLNARQVALLGFEDVLEDGFTPARPILPLVEVLPPNLKYLIIENCTLFAIPQLEEVLANLSGMFPDLQSIGVEPVDLNLGEPGLSSERSKERLNRLAQLRNGFRNAGVRWTDTSQLVKI